MNRRELAYSICACSGFIIFYIIAYRDMLFQNSLFWALNGEPLPTLNSRFIVPGMFYWYPGSLGCPAQPNISSWLYYALVFITGGNLVLAEKFLVSATLVSCFTMYFFLSNHFRGSRLACFSAAIIYGFGPATVLDFTDTVLWGYAMIPIIFNYLLNILAGERKIKDMLVLGLSLSFMTAFLPQDLPLILLSFLIFPAVYVASAAQKLAYIRKILVSILVAVLVFVITSPYLISGVHSFLVLIGIQSSSTLSSFNVFTYNGYLIDYANQGIANIIRLIGGSPTNHLSESSWIGFALPVLAFASLLLVRKGKQMLNLLALALLSAVVLTVIYGVHLQAGWAMWLLQNTPVRLWYFSERPLYIVAFAYSVMICVTVKRLTDTIHSLPSRSYFARMHLVSWGNLKRGLSILLVLTILMSVFTFAPAFNEQLQQERYNPLPPVYLAIQNWLTSHVDGRYYRVMFLPTDSFSMILGNPDSVEYTPGIATSLTQSYVDYVYNQLVTDSTHNFGSLIAPASVKYIILATPDLSTLWRGSPALFAPLYPFSSGPVMYVGGGVQGNPVDIERILDGQSDLKLVYVETDFRVYENTVCLPKISIFSSATYVVGSTDAFSVLSQMPGFSSNTDMLIFANQNPSLTQELAEASSSIVFFNTDVTDYAGLRSLPMNTPTVYENTMNQIGLKNQLYLFTQNSSTFSRQVTMPAGEYHIAVSAPSPQMVTPSMNVINLDSEQEFVIDKANFKSDRGQTYDFDLANYYFVTAKGGNFTIKIEGSGWVAAYIAINSTLSNINFGGQVGKTLPSNGTFTISLPPNTSFQPLVFGYNPSIGHNVTDDISKIVIQSSVGGNYSNITVDGVAVASAQTSEENGFNTFGPIPIQSGTHNFTITNGISGSLIAIYNTPNLAEIFSGNGTINYNFNEQSETNYKVEVNTSEPLFISLSESYDSNWQAYSEGEQLMHFTGFSYSNVFYINKTVSRDLYVNIEYKPPMLNYLYIMQQFSFAAMGIIAITLLIADRIKHRVRHTILAKN